MKLKPSYVEGYWYQGTAYYTLQKFGECRDRFSDVVRLAPTNGAAYAFLGLCEYGLKEFDKSLPHLLKSRTLGVGGTNEKTRPPAVVPDKKGSTRLQPPIQVDDRHALPVRPRDHAIARL